MTDQSPFMSDALKALTKADSLAHPLVQGGGDRTYAMVPDGYKLQDITDPNRLPVRPKGLVTVDDRASLVAYANRFKTASSIIFADYDKGTITALLDWHPHNQEAETFGQAGALQHQVQLRILPSEEFTRWDAIEGEMHKQADFALFLEENASDIHTPEPAHMMELARDLEGTTGIAFKSRTRLKDGSHGFRFEAENSIVSEVQAPDQFSLMIPVYHGEEPELLVAKFRWRPTQQALVMGFAWHRVEYMRRARFTLIAAAAAEETGLPWVAGRPLS